jgi:hypothetical protein
MENQMNAAAAFKCKFRDARRRLIRSGKPFPALPRAVSKRNHAVKLKPAAVRDRRDHTGNEPDRKLLF